MNLKQGNGGDSRRQDPMDPKQPLNQAAMFMIAVLQFLIELWLPELNLGCGACVSMAFQRLPLDLSTRCLCSWEPASVVRFRLCVQLRLPRPRLCNFSFGLETGWTQGNSSQNFSCCRQADHTSWFALLAQGFIMYVVGVMLKWRFEVLSET